jgi:ribosome biogenesis GTPase
VGYSYAKQHESKSMTRDYSQFSAKAKAPTKRKVTLLERLGWQSFFAQQVDADDLLLNPPARVTQVHRNSLHVVGETVDTTIVYPEEEITVGDWILLNEGHTKPERILERQSLIKRRGAGHDRHIQMIAANLSTAFIVSSCNRDFNVARIERYIALAFEADVEPVIVLTKTDLCDDVEPFLLDAQAISDNVPVLVLNALSNAPKRELAQWCKIGQTIAFLGSSGVGKSTLVNALTGSNVNTQGVREADARGRHTTTSRHLHLTADSCAVLDTPGMRELQVIDAASGISDLFPDLHNLTLACKFSDCSHQIEPGCAILAAVAEERIDTDRLARWKKLATEEQVNSNFLAQRKFKDKKLGKLIKNVKKQNRK